MLVALTAFSLLSSDHLNLFASQPAVFEVGMVAAE
jgi:hypothetical protein